MPAPKVRIYHNPRCTKSREALALLREHGHEPEIVLYLEAAPGEEELNGLLKKLEIAPHDLVRSKEDAYKKAGLSVESGVDEIVNAIAEHPILLERPIVLVGERAVIGRPPERILALLG